MGSIQEFITKRKKLGHITAARFDVSMTLGEEWGKAELLQDDAIEFSLASIDLPTVRGNYEQVYFDTMPVEVFKNFTYDPDFSMTVICDNEGKIYKQFQDLILRKENVVGKSGEFDINYEGNFDFKQKIEPDISLTVKALVDTGTPEHKFNSSTPNPNKYGLTYKLYGVYIKNIGNLSFSNNSSEIMTFSVNAAATSFEINPEKDSPYANDVPAEATFPGEEGYTPPPHPNDGFDNTPEVSDAMSKEDRNNVVEAYKESLSNNSEENNDASAETDDYSDEQFLNDMGINNDSSSKTSQIPSDQSTILTETQDNPPTSNQTPETTDLSEVFDETDPNATIIQMKNPVTARLNEDISFDNSQSSVSDNMEVSVKESPVVNQAREEGKFESNVEKLANQTTLQEKQNPTTSQEKSNTQEQKQSSVQLNNKDDSVDITLDDRLAWFDDKNYNTPIKTRHGTLTRKGEKTHEITMNTKNSKGEILTIPLNTTNLGTYTVDWKNIRNEKGQKVSVTNTNERNFLSRAFDYDINQSILKHKNIDFPRK